MAPESQVRRHCGESDNRRTRRARHPCGAA